MKGLFRELSGHAIKVILGILMIAGILVLFEKYTKWLYTVAPSELVSWFQSFGWLAPVILVLLYVLFNTLLTPSIPFVFVAGMVYGIIGGLVLALVAELISATINFYLGRKMSGLLFRTEKHHIKVKRYMKYIERHGFLVVFVLRFVGFYFDIISYASGMTKIKFKDYFFATALGFFPYLFIYVYAGWQLIDIRSSAFIFSILIMKSVVYASAGAGFGYYFWRNKHAL